MKISELKSTEYNPYYGTYIKLNEARPLQKGLSIGLSETLEFFASIPNDKLEYRYEEGKWTIKEICLHLIDTERVFAYRALRIARKDKTPLMGFDQDMFVELSQANHRSMDHLLKEYRSLRESTIDMFSGFSNDMLTYIGEASDSPLSPRAAGFIIAGHEKHHIQVIKERYL